MIHRYLAMAVGVLIIVLALVSWRWRGDGRTAAVALVGRRDAGVGVRAGRLRRVHGDDEALSRPSSPRTCSAGWRCWCCWRAGTRRYVPRPLRAAARPARAALRGRRSCSSPCRSRSAAGSAPTMRCWPAPTSRTARAVVAADGLRSTASRCCASSAQTAGRRLAAVRGADRHPHARTAWSRVSWCSRRWLALAWRLRARRRCGASRSALGAAGRLAAGQRPVQRRARLAAGGGAGAHRRRGRPGAAADVLLARARPPVPRPRRGVAGSDRLRRIAARMTMPCPTPSPPGVRCLARCASSTR